MTNQANTLPDTLRELTTGELDHVGGAGHPFDPGPEPTISQDVSSFTNGAIKLPSTIPGNNLPPEAVSAIGSALAL